MKILAVRREITLPHLFLLTSIGERERKKTNFLETYNLVLERFHSV